VGKYLKLYGLQRSGTNYLKWIVEQNFECFVLQNWLGWKHGKVLYLKDDESYYRDLCRCELTTEQKAEIKFVNTPRIAIKKNVHSWLVSMHRYKFFDWGDYQRMVNIYYESNVHYEKHCFMVEYEELMFHPEDTLKCIQSMFSLDRRGDWVLSSGDVMPRGGDEHTDTWKGRYANKKFKTDYYKNKEYLNEIPNLPKINAYLNDFTRT